MNVIKKAFNSFLNLIYPPKCAFCRRVMEPDTDEYVCRACSLTLHYCAGQLCCKRCGKPFPSLGEKKICLDCLAKHTVGYKRIISVLEYDAAVRRSISAYKGKTPQRQNARVYARLMKQMIDLEYSDIAFDYIIAVPPSRRRMSVKNFDHIDWLCRCLSKKTGISLLRRCLVQTGSVRKQSSLSYSERKVNLIGSIKVRKRTKKLLSGKTCLLVDDICTTGSTIEECSRVLKRAGAKTVYAVTLATVTKNRRKRDE